MGALTSGFCALLQLACHRQSAQQAVPQVSVLHAAPLLSACVLCVLPGFLVCVCVCAGCVAARNVAVTALEAVC